MPKSIPYLSWTHIFVWWMVSGYKNGHKIHVCKVEWILCSKFVKCPRINKTKKWKSVKIS
jgi:hypothetical protein